MTAADELTARYRAQAARLAEVVAGRLRMAALSVDAGSVDAMASWWDLAGPRLEREVATGQKVLAKLTRVYLREHARLNGVVLDPVVVEPAMAQIARSLEATGPAAYRAALAASGGEQAAAVRAMGNAVRGAGVRLVMEGSRRTTMDTFRARREMAGWRRVGGAKSCAFCLMLTSRGAVYSRTSVAFRAHDHCSCTAEPVYRRGEMEPERVRRLESRWREVTAGHDGADALNAWRRHLHRNQ